MSFSYIDGGVCAAKGFRASGVHCGVRKNKSKRDLGLLVADVPCTAAGVFTRNRVKAAPVLLDMEHIKGGVVRAVLANSGNANACAPEGYENALRMACAVSAALEIPKEQVIVSSTGVIGQRLNVEAIEAGVAPVVEALSYDGSHLMSEVILTTDLKEKTCAVSFDVGGVKAAVGGICKGSGMIHPNMGTMLSYITTDISIAQPLLDRALRTATDKTFNCVSVDGDTSTNDTCILMASGLAGNAMIETAGADYEAFLEALTAVMRTLARAIAADGEGATKLITCKVSGGADDSQALALAKGVISSSLTKAAMFGADANWGRVLCAMGYTDVPFDPDTVSVRFISAAGESAVCKNGRPLDFDEDLAKRVLSEKEVVIDIALPGAGCAEAWGCDLTYEYVKINGDYRT